MVLMPDGFPIAPQWISPILTADLTATECLSASESAESAPVRLQSWTVASTPGIRWVRWADRLPSPIGPGPIQLDLNWTMKCVTVVTAVARYQTLAVVHWDLGVVLPPIAETLPIASIPHIVSYKAGLMLCWYTPWVGHITI